MAQRPQRISIPNGRNAKVMATRPISPFRRSADAPFGVSIGTGPVTSGTLLTAVVTPPLGAEVVTYQWTTAGANIAGATSATYTPVIGVGGVTDLALIRCVVTIDGTTYLSNSRSIVYPAAVNTVTPVVSGSLGLGSVLSVTNGTWTGAVGGAYSYQWRRAGVNIPGATANTYTITVADSAFQITCVVTYTNSGGAVSATSNAVTVQTFTLPAIAGVPTISGSPIVGQTLTASPASVTGNPTPSRTWQWRRSGSPIPGATSITYLLVPADEGDTITVVQTETNALGSDNEESAATSVVTSGPLPVNPVIATASYSSTGGGAPDTLTISGTYSGPDILDMTLLFREAATLRATASILALTVSGGNFAFNVNLQNSDLVYEAGSSAANMPSVDSIFITINERTNGGSATRNVPGVSGLDFTAATFVSGSPADNATGVAVDANIVLTFSENVFAGTGNFIIRNVTDGVDIETFNIATGVGSAGGSISIAGAAVTINPFANLPNNKVISIRWVAGVLVDVKGNPVVANTGDTLYNFTTVAAASFTRLGRRLGDAAVEVGPTGTLTLGTLSAVGFDRRIVVHLNCMYGPGVHGDPAQASIVAAGVTLTRDWNAENTGGRRHKGCFSFSGQVNATLSGNINLVIGATGPEVWSVCAEWFEGPTTTAFANVTRVDDSPLNGTRNVSQTVAAGSLVLVGGAARENNSSCSWSSGVIDQVSHYSPASSRTVFFGHVPGTSAGTQTLIGTITGETGDEEDIYYSIEYTA